MGLRQSLARVHAERLRADNLRAVARSTCASSQRLRREAAAARRRTRFPMPGGADASPDEHPIRARIRQLIREGALQREMPKRLSAAQSEGGGQCPACGRDFVRGETVYQITTPNDVSFTIHKRCVEFWLEETREQ